MKIISPTSDERKARAQYPIAGPPDESKQPRLPVLENSRRSPKKTQAISFPESGTAAEISVRLLLPLCFEAEELKS